MANENAKFMKNAYVGWTDTNGKYYPHDFDPSKIAPDRKFRKDKGRCQAMQMRMMMPFSMSCLNCGEFMYIGTKFNSQCTKVPDMDYLGISMYRFTGRCKHCHSNFQFRTDPKSANYILEKGGKRQYEAHQDADIAVASLKEQKEKEKNDAMLALEQKRVEMEREMQAHDDLERLMFINKRQRKDLDTLDSALAALFNGETNDAVKSLELEDVHLMDEEMEDELEAFEMMQRAQKDQEFEEDKPKEPIAKVAPDPPKPAVKRPGALFTIKKKAKIEPGIKEPERSSSSASASTEAPNGSSGSSCVDKTAQSSAPVDKPLVAPAPAAGGLLGGAYSSDSD